MKKLLFPLVSVIVPIYNVEPYLREALDSVINQTYKNLEIILIDDGSTDGAGRICDQYQKRDKRIRVIHQANKGLSGARNTGLNIMRGEIVFFLDPDDAFLPDMIECLVRCMIKTRADIAICGYYACRTVKRMIKNNSEYIFKIERGVVSSKTALKLLMDDKLSFVVWNKAYRRDLFKELRFPDGYVYEDRILMPYLIKKATSITMIDQPLILHRRRPGSISTTYSEQNMLDWICSKKATEAFLLAYIPAVFSPQDMDQYKDSFFREIVLWYSQLLSVPDTVSQKVQKTFECEMENRVKNIQHYSMITKVCYYLYKADPRLCYYTKQIYSTAKIGVNRLLMFSRESFKKRQQKTDSVNQILP